jgi:sialate O-acetylesterase
VVWFRKTVDVPEAWAGKEALLRLGTIDDLDTTWVNGTLVGANDTWTTLREYALPAGLLKAGPNCIAVRVLDTGGAGGLYGKPEDMELRGPDGATISLAGRWQYKDSVALGAATPMPQRLDSNPNVVTVLYNGMIAPLTPFAIKGAIWYQGESNAGRDEQYARLLPTMIRDWQTAFEVAELPFFIVQLANFMGQDAEPRDDAWPHLREAQWVSSLAADKGGLAVAIDIGDAADIHPRNKQDVGLRLALSALAIAYDKDIVYSGPLYTGMAVEGNKVRLSFDHVGGGLVAKGERLTGFAIAGADKHFVWADATIDGDTVLVSSDKVANPVAVRYAWGNNPVCNLYNAADLPAVPFRTDR